MTENDKSVITLNVKQLKEIIREAIKEVASFRKEMTIPEVFGIEELSKMTGYARGTIYRKTSKKEIPHTKIGKKLLFKREEILDYISRGKQESVSDFCEREQLLLSKRRKRLHGNNN